MPVRFYVATGLERFAVARAVAGLLVERDGWEWTYNWTTHGSVQTEGEDRIREVAEHEAAGVCMADVVIVMLPGGRGTHTELGIALALGKRVVLWVPPEAREAFLGERVCAFYLHPAVEIVEGSMTDLFAALRLDREGIPPRGPGSARHVYVPESLSSVEVENPANASDPIWAHVPTIGSPTKLVPGASFGVARDSKRSAARFSKMALINEQAGGER